MRNVFFFLTLLAIITGCNQKPETKEPQPFDFTIKGTVTGMDTGKIFFSESPRIGDEVFIPVKKGKFSYTGKSFDIFSSGIGLYENYFSNEGIILPFVIEPGIIEIELHKDSIFYGSKIVQGNINVKFNRVIKTVGRYIDEVYDNNNSKEDIEKLKKVYGDSLMLLIKNNLDNYCSVYLLNSLKDWGFLDIASAHSLIKLINNPGLRNTPDYKSAFSNYIAIRDSINVVGTKAANFILPDISGKMIDFNEINNGKMVFVEKSGSWCGNQTQESQSLKPVYERYKDNGFEIVTIVQEAKYDRWKNWVKEQQFPWINVVEMEYGNSNDVFYEDFLFANGDYLVDENGIVVATGIPASRLNEILMEKYEPEKYEDYLKTKWDLPESTYILDKEKPVTSFAELAGKLKGKPFFIDCWATWCSPCIEEFQYNTQLQEFLKNNNIELVYIAFDKKLNDAKWLYYIRKYNLRGYNMRINDDFVSDFDRITHWSSALPSYFIVGGKGKIVQEQLLHPSDKEKLFEQILEKLTLEN